MAFEIIDTPMKCCGMVMAQGFNETISTGKKSPYGNFMEVRSAAKKDFEDRLDAVVNHQETHGRNCAIITLSTDQFNVKEIAEERGFKVVHEFYNPNSDNQVYILARVDYENKDAYMADHPEEEEEED